MSHLITEKDTMMAVRKPPWHGLGTVLPEAPATVEEALTLSGLAWTVEQRKLFWQPEGSWRDPIHHTVPIEGHVANVRMDRQEVLGIVSDSYKVVQNEDAFRWLDALLGHEVEFETAGSMKGGRIVWVLARIDTDRVEIGGDKAIPYMFCANSHDGSMSVITAASRVRVVCWNTLSAALNMAERVYRFRHTGDLTTKFDEAREALDLALRWDEQFAALADHLATEPVSTKRMEKLCVDLFRPDEDGITDRARKGRERRIETVRDLFSPNAATSGNSPGTAWHAYNAFAEFADWGRSKATDQMQRSFTGGAFKQEALARTIEAVGLSPRVEGVVA